MTLLGHILSTHDSLDQSGVTGGGLDPYNVHALFINMDNMWMERFGNYDCLVLTSFNRSRGEAEPLPPPYPDPLLQRVNRGSRL